MFFTCWPVFDESEYDSKHVAQKGLKGLGGNQLSTLSSTLGGRFGGGGGGCLPWRWHNLTLP